ncbi:Uu.00g131790.m01.CDS01 [Anthostomella pinea]|uniref:Uu.00g131790.m01.CDS01 n=1 Tax=Anthostomella pinea TaxID=933095 RepID=A0AAI8VJW9_9PEZI|nr:Uu.00g131790.m01.CDS01 [Anthostomella pinea]
MVDDEYLGFSKPTTMLDGTNVAQQDGNDANQEGGKERARRIRSSKPKVKTGCYNCKMRRIKCDERRPECTQCIRSKKICTGYPPPPQQLSTFDASKSNQAYKVPPRPHTGVEPTTIAEDRGQPTQTDQSTLASGTPSHGQATQAIDWHIQQNDTLVSQGRAKHKGGSACLLLRAATWLLQGTVKATKNDQCNNGSKVTMALTRALEGLALWDERHSVSEGRLDTILEMSTRVRNATLSSLCRVVSTISNSIIPKLSGDASRLELEAVMEGFTNGFNLARIIDEDDEDDSNLDDDIDDDNTDSERETLDDHLKDLDEYIRGLNDLDSSLANPAMDAVTVPSRTSTEKAVPLAKQGSSPLSRQHFYSLRIRDLFPEVSDYLADHLGQSNWERYCLILGTREQGAKQVDEDDPPLDIEYTLRNPSWYGSSRPGAATLPDSGVGTSLQTYTALRSQLSSAVSGIGDGFYSAFPSLSKEAKAGKPFECDACGRQVVVTRSRLWKKHLLDDLQPYICIVPGCEVDRTPFPSQIAWIEHIRSKHSSTDFLQHLCCPFCKVSAPREVFGMLTHIAKHLEVISAIPLPRYDPDDTAEESSQSMSMATNAASDESDEVLRNVANFVESNATAPGVPLRHVEGVTRQLSV